MTLTKFQFRKLDKRDFCEASNLVWNVFNEFEVPDYSSQGILTFKEFIKPENLYKNNETGSMNFWGCFDEQKLVGIIALRGDRHISLLFVMKEYQHKGIATKLFNELKSEVITSNPNTEFITVNSSPFAVKVYEQLGFIAINKELIQDGIRFTPMKYMLSKH